MAARSWCFTINNYTDQDKKTVADLRDKCTVVYASYEIGKEKGTPHIQGYCTFKKNTTQKKALTAISLRASIRKAGGTKQENASYIFKEDSEVFINQDNGKPGRRTDLDTACELLKDGGVLKVAQEMPSLYVKFYKGLERLYNIVGPKKDPNKPPTVIWLYGKTGTGKTRWVYSNFHPDEIYKAPATGLQWFDGYVQQRCYLLDDYRSDTASNSFKHLLGLTDRYPDLQQSKGGFVQFNSDYIIITAPHHPSLEFPNMLHSSDNIDQLFRRIQYIGEFTIDDQNPNAETQILWTNSQSEATEAPWIDGSVQDSDSSISDASEVQD